MTLAEKYGYEFSSEHPSNPASIYNSYKFRKPSSSYYISFDSFTVKSKNIHCWKINANWPFVKEEGKYAYVKPVEDKTGKLGFETTFESFCEKITFFKFNF